MPEYNKIDSNLENFQPIPEWICTDYVEKVLREYYRDDSLQIIDISIKPATAKGENYASVMSRVRVKYTGDNVNGVQDGSYLIKSSFEGDEFASGKMSSYDIYSREMEIYSKIFPKLREILKMEGFDEELVPITLKIDHDHDSIMFEDLTTRAYDPPDRFKGFDLLHAKMVLRKLAKLQAASAVLGNVAPEVFQSYDRGMFNRHTEAYSPLYVDSLQVCSEVVSKIPGYEKYAKKLYNLKKVLMEYGKRVFDCKNDHLNVLVHGDLWITNTMFKYDENKQPIDVILIDFQYSVWTSPTIDLHYFFYTSMAEELINDCQEELVQYYYEELTKTLRNLCFKGPIPSLKQFWKEFMETSFYSVISGCLIKPYQINEKTADADFAALMMQDERAKKFKATVFSNERVHKLLMKLLPVFDRKGLLDLYQ